MNGPDELTLQVDEFRPPRRSLRVALVTETYPPEVNGVAATIARVVDGLRAGGHELQLIRPRQGRADEPGQAEGFHEVLLRGLPIPRYPQLKMGLPSQRALQQLWTQQRPDVVHLVTEGPLGWSALRAAIKLRLPVVSDFRTNFHAYSRHYGVAWLHGPIMGYLRKFHNRTACTMVPTEELARSLADSGFRRLKVVARGVDTQLFDPRRRNAALRAAWGADEHTPVVLCVGRLAPEKNLGVLAQAFEAMVAAPTSTGARFKLVLVGDGPARAALEARLPHAVFAGTRRGEDLAEHYASADVFLFASVTETFGNVVPEAMASGLAVLAYDYAAASLLIREGDSGLVAPLDDAAAFVRQAVRLATEPALARALGASARRVAERQSWSRIVTLIEQAYASAIAGAALTPAAAARAAAWPARS
jgi:glycosyltransferase involved in cell wall biosynthesis